MVKKQVLAYSPPDFTKVVVMFCRYLLLSLMLYMSTLSAFDDDIASNLLNDMIIVNYWNQRINDHLPVTYNHLLQGGYINMPSARMGDEGEVGAGYASVPPYRLYNLRAQLIDRLEVTGSYRIYKGVDDPILTPLGFGDRSDKGVNIKLSLFAPEESDYALPGVSIGFDDLIGTRSFKSQYIVLTHVLRDYDCEFSLGYGMHRIRGFFGGMSYMPFRRCCDWSFLQSLSLVAEYDAIPYKSHRIEKHPKGHVQKTPINLGVKYRLFDHLDFSASYIRGDAFAFSASAFYNFGMTEGFLPKIDDPCHYQAPVILEPIGCRRSEEVMIQDLLYAMRRQGLDLLEALMANNDCGERILRLHVMNLSYMSECELRSRIEHLLVGLIPENVDHVEIVLESEGFPVQEYHYQMDYVRQYGAKLMNAQELRVVTPMREVTGPLCIMRRIFKKNRDLWNLEVYPKTHTFFGSARGKLKYALGLNFGLNGYLFDDLYYSIVVGWIFASDLGHITGVDRLNPSQLPNVRTDIIEYYKQEGITIDEAYLQRNWNLGRGLYSRAAVGMFEEEYGGVAAEVLYYPIVSDWSVGVEGAYLRKRATRGLKFSDRVRQLDGFVPSFHKFHGSQYFLDIYYRWREARLDFKAMIGKFLANDFGMRTEVSRYFPSGLQITLWYTITNGHDRINGSSYNDKGISFSMPLDIFYTYSDLSRWGYGMSAWLRDVGIVGQTGMPLYDLIREQRVD